MITEIVTFALPAGIDREQVARKFRQTAPAWSKNQDLVQKFYFFDAARSLGGGVYVWKTKAAALRWHGEDYRQRIRSLYGSEPAMAYYDTVLVVDNLRGDVTEPVQG